MRRNRKGQYSGGFWDGCSAGVLPDFILDCQQLSPRQHPPKVEYHHSVLDAVIVRIRWHGTWLRNTQFSSCMMIKFLPWCFIWSTCLARNPNAKVSYPCWLIKVGFLVEGKVQVVKGGRISDFELPKWFYFGSNQTPLLTRWKVYSVINCFAVKFITAFLGNQICYSTTRQLNCR